MAQHTTERRFLVFDEGASGCGELQLEMCTREPSERGEQECLEGEAHCV